MNVYDFDQTIFQPDSSYCFVMYCLRHYPRAVLHCLPGVSYTGIQALRKQAETKELKEQVFSFLPRLDDVQRIVEEFWDAHRQNLEPWYLAQKRDDDLIVSASPDFLLRPICEELGVSLIATPMDPARSTASTAMTRKRYGASVWRSRTDISRTSIPILFPIPPWQSLRTGPGS